MNIQRQSLSLRETMNTMHELLRGEISPAEASRILGAPVERLAVYQSFVKAHINGVLEKDFPILHALLDDPIWQHLTDGYFAEYPADSYELNRCAQAFPEYLADVVERGRLPELTDINVELALHEWTEFEVFASETEIPNRSQVLHPMLNPTLAIREFDYPVSAFVRDARLAMASSDHSLWPQVPTRIAPEVVFILRHPDTQLATFYKASDEQLFAFKVLHDQIGPDQAARTSGLDRHVIINVLSVAAEQGLAILPSGWLPRMRAKV